MDHQAQLIRELDEQYTGREYERKFYEHAITVCRENGILEELDLYRRAFIQYRVMKPGFVMEWIADNVMYEENLSSERLAYLVSACDDSFNVNCWLKLLRLVMESNLLSSTEKDAVFQKATSTVGNDLTKGVQIWQLFSEYTGSNLNCEEHVASLMLKASKDPQRLKQLEGKIQSSQANIEDHLALISHLKGTKAVDVLCAVYRRMLFLYPRETEKWLEFIEYLKETTPRPQVEYICDLACRSNPQDIRLWLENLFHSETFSGLNELESIYKSADMALEQCHGADSEQVISFSVEFAALLKRKSDSLETFSQSCQSIFGSAKGKRLQYVKSFVARVYYQYQQPHNGRAIYNELIESRSKDPQFWQEYAQAEVPFDQAAARNIFARGVGSMSVPAEGLFESWLDFERIHGTRETYLKAKVRIDAQRRLIKERMPEKRPEYAEKKVPEQPSKRAKMEEIGEEEETMMVDLPPQPELTVFVGNVDFKLSSGQLKDFFQLNAGPVKAVHMGLSGTGKSRGFASVEFEEKATVEKALSLDRTRINGRPMFISRYQVVGGKDWKPAVSHPSGRDPKTLYVSRLVGETSEADLTQLFSTHGQIKGIRLGLNNDGTCKGFAYVEFESPDMAHAGLAEDGKILRGQAISVLISDPTKAPKNQTRKLAMVPPSLSRHKPKAKLALDKP